MLIFTSDASNFRRNRNDWLANASKYWSHKKGTLDEFYYAICFLQVDIHYTSNSMWHCCLLKIPWWSWLGYCDPVCGSWIVVIVQSQDVFVVQSPSCNLFLNEILQKPYFFIISNVMNLNSRSIWKKDLFFEHSNLLFVQNGCKANDFLHVSMSNFLF